MLETTADSPGYGCAQDVVQIEFPSRLSSRVYVKSNIEGLRLSEGSNQPSSTLVHPGAKSIVSKLGKLGKWARFLLLQEIYPRVQRRGESEDRPLKLECWRRGTRSELKRRKLERASASPASPRQTITSIFTSFEGPLGQTVDLGCVFLDVPYLSFLLRLISKPKFEEHLTFRWCSHLFGPVKVEGCQEGQRHEMMRIVRLLADRICEIHVFQTLWFDTAGVSSWTTPIAAGVVISKPVTQADIVSCILCLPILSLPVADRLSSCGSFA